MKAARIMIILMAAALLVFGLSGAAFAFHNGGVGFCEGCHTMHNSITSGTTPAYAPDQLIGAGTGGWTGAAGNSSYNTNSGANGGAMSIKAGNGANQYLLKGSDPSSTCLNCHKANTGTPSYYQEMSDVSSDAGSVQNPAGDFQWVASSYTYTLVNPDNSTATAVSQGENHGHKVIAQDFSMTTSNSLLTNAPGSSLGSTNKPYPAANLACNSCHDPHGHATRGYGAGNGSGGQAAGHTAVIIKASGSYGPVGGIANANLGPYRLLAGAGYDPGGSIQYDSMDTEGLGSYLGFPAQTTVTGTIAAAYGGLTGFAYVNGGTAVNAIAPGSTKWAEKDDEAGTQQHNAYGSGMSEFCANCHNLLLNTGNTSGTSSHKHPAGNGAAMDLVYVNYNDYYGTGSFAASAPYWGIVPFEAGAQDSIATLANFANGTTPETADLNSQVMCLTCHRAHATAFDHDTRWDTYATFMSNSSVEMSSMKGTAQEWRAVYNSQAAQGKGTAGAYQRQLCNKCHGQD